MTSRCTPFGVTAEIKSKRWQTRPSSSATRYIAITDHIGSLKIANAMDETRIAEQRKEIEALNRDLRDIRK